jgi:hypothetical protein
MAEPRDSGRDRFGQFPRMNGHSNCHRSGGEVAMNCVITRIASFVRLHPLHPLQPRPVATGFARLTW